MLEKFPDPFLAEIAAQPAAIRRSAAGLHHQLAALRRVPAVRNGCQLVHGDGVIVLLHTWPAPTVEALQPILQRLRSAGCRFVTVAGVFDDS